MPRGVLIGLRKLGLNHPIEAGMGSEQEGSTL